MFTNDIMLSMSHKQKGGQGGETIIAEGVKVEGDFTSQGNVTIDGHVSGNVATTGDIVIGERAMIDADVSAVNATVAGRVKGILRVSERLDLSASARVQGDVEARVVSMAPGCVLNGKMTMSEEAGVVMDVAMEREPVQA